MWKWPMGVFTHCCPSAVVLAPLSWKIFICRWPLLSIVACNLHNNKQYCLDYSMDSLIISFTINNKSLQHNFLFIPVHNVVNITTWKGSMVLTSKAYSLYTISQYSFCINCLQLRPLLPVIQYQLLLFISRELKLVDSTSAHMTRADIFMNVNNEGFHSVNASSDLECIQKVHWKTV